MTLFQVLEPIVRDTIAPAAADTDREARFPRRALDALGAAGLLGLLSSQEVGGLGLGLGDAVQVVQRIAQDCPATAMVLTMHYAGTALVEKYGSAEVRRAMKLSQEELAAILHINQASVAKMEKRTDMYIGTLRRFIQAMGGELEIVARFPDRQIRIDQFSQDAAEVVAR